MNWIPKYDELKLVVVNATGLAVYDEEKCKFCGRYGCTDRGYTLASGDPSVTIGEAEWVAQVQQKLAERIEANKEDINVHCTDLAERQCIRKLKKSNMQAVLEKLVSCGPNCHRNLNCADGGIEGGVWKERGEDYHCPFRYKNMECQRNLALDLRPLTCLPDKEGVIECEFHEEAFNRCFRKEEGKPCYNLKDKLGVMDEKLDILLLLVHRFSIAPCRYCEENTCRNENSIHYEGMCVLNGLMTTCEQYASVDPELTDTEGVFTSVSGIDDPDPDTLVMACHLCRSISKTTGLKNLGVRRTVDNPFLNDKNPLHANTVQINYLFLTYPGDVAKFHPDKMAQAVFDALINNCEGLGCNEIETCDLID